MSILTSDKFELYQQIAEAAASAATLSVDADEPLVVVGIVSRRDAGYAVRARTIASQMWVEVFVEVLTTQLRRGWGGNSRSQAGRLGL